MINHRRTRCGIHFLVASRSLYAFPIAERAWPFHYKLTVSFQNPPQTLLWREGSFYLNQSKGDMGQFGPPEMFSSFSPSHFHMVCNGLL